MKFIADVMLGRLAKRLRLLGFDVLYGSGLDDNEILRLSLEQDRMILTRDAALAGRPLASRSLLIRHDKTAEQVRQVFEDLKLSAVPTPLTRCSVCNHLLEAADKQDVRDLVPSHVLATRTTFYRCSGCGRIYWKGSHVARMGRNTEGISGRTVRTSRPAAGKSYRK